MMRALNLTPWPKCIVKMRDGSTQKGDVAHVGDTHVTVRLSVAPWEVPGIFGKETIDFRYKDFAKEYVQMEEPK